MLSTPVPPEFLLPASFSSFSFELQDKGHTQFFSFSFFLQHIELLVYAFWDRKAHSLELCVLSPIGPSCLAFSFLMLVECLSRDVVLYA